MSKQTAKTQRMFIESLEGIGDILVYETKRQKNKLVLEGLGKIKSAIEGILELQAKEPQKFEALIASPEFRKLHKTDEKEAQLRLVFNADDYMVGFSTPINQIIRIYETAVDSQNETVSREAAYQLNRILSLLSKKPKNGLFVEQILQKIAKILRIALKRGDVSMFSASINWYIRTVFDKEFDLSYLELFDKYFFSTIRYIVVEEHTTLFEALISALVEQIHVPFYDRKEIWNYGQLIRGSDLSEYKRLNDELKINDRVKVLENTTSDLDSKDKLDSWFQNFKSLKKALTPHIPKNQSDKAHELEGKIEDYAIAQFKYLNLLEIVFAIGAYCIFKKRYSYIKYLWEYKQPEDTDTVWVGHDIVPTSLDEVVTFYFKKELFDRAFDFWEGHHGSEKYYKQYFLLLLARLLKNMPPDNEGNYPQVKDYRLPDLHVYRLSDLIHSTDELKTLAAELSKKTAFLEEVDLVANDCDLFKEKVISLLERLRQEANEQIVAKQKSQTINSKKVEEFKSDVVKAFYKSATIREIFINYFHCYEDLHDKKVAAKMDRFGFDTVTPQKAAFFEEWYINYLGFGEGSGRNLAHGENSCLLKTITEKSQDVSNRRMEEIFGQFENPEDIVIFSTNIGIWQYFEKSPNFKSKWHGVEQLNLEGFEGWYEFKGVQIPIFKIYKNDADHQILIINKSKFGKLVQLSPLNEGDDAKLMNDIFYMNVQAFSENKDLMDDILKKPPDWLKNIGDEQKQREHLTACVRISVFERFEYKTDEDFQGYKLSLHDEEEKEMGTR
ncbi:MAG: hypothetical protein ABIE74_07775 [Pseudomonadota bacterium]